MKKMIMLAAATTALLTSPAMAAGEGRVEARGGIAWATGNSEAFAGVGAGYDFDLGDTAFVGLDLGADKVLTSGTKVLWSVGGRIGAKVGEKGKLYANGGIGFCCGTSDPFIGVGYQHKLSDKLYAKVEYRNIIIDSSPNVNFAGVGVGLSF